MAGGWARDGAEQEQIEATIKDALERSRLSMPSGESASICDECEKPIPKARQIAIPGVQHCVNCQQELEAHAKKFELFNRRGSKDSQLR